MSFDAKRFLNDHRIPWTDRGKHSRPGWAQVVCPFCSGNPGWHGGFNIEAGYYNCWRCGFTWLPKAVATILKISIPKSKTLIEKYLSPDAIREFKERRYADEVLFPPKTGPLNRSQRSYLEDRNFDPDLLQEEWEIKGVGHIGAYKGRILAPIRLHGRLISYQTRDIYEKSGSKYMACPKDEEVYDHQYSLYGIDQCKSKNVLAVEGITDVWRLGPGSVGTFGIDYTSKQILMLGQNFDRVFIFYDTLEEQANQKAHHLAEDLEMIYKVESEIITYTGGDPAEMPDDEAAHLMRELCITS